MPFSHPPYDPFSTVPGGLDRILDECLSEALRREPRRLEPLRLGYPGVYVLYYTGPYKRYKHIVSPVATVPIYIGQGSDVGKRLSVHHNTLSNSRNLDVRDFLFRVLPLPPRASMAFEQVIEERLILRFQPEWNVRLKGFGNDGRRGSPWDDEHGPPGGRRGINDSPEAGAPWDGGRAAYDNDFLFKGGKD